METLTIWILFFSLLLSAFFSGIEIAFLSSNRLQIELENKKGNLASRILSIFTKKPGAFIAAMLVGNNIALVVYGVFVTDLLDPAFAWSSNDYLTLFLQTLISTAVLLVFAEFLPKAVFSTRPNDLLKFFVLPLSFFYALFYPLVKAIIVFSEFLLRSLFNVQIKDQEPVFGKIDLDNFISEKTAYGRNNEENELDPEIEIFQNALEFSETKAREFMIPRTELVAVPVDESMESLRNKFVDHGYSKIMVYEENIDNITGYVHAYDLFKRPANIKEILRPILFIPESMPASEILNTLMKGRRSLAVVVDEFGGTSGLVTLEDVVEELLGEIDDEHDVEELTEQDLGNGEFLFSARHEMDYLNNKYNLNLPESENYNTLGGLIFNTSENIPEKGDRISIGKYTFVILKVKANAIQEVKIIPHEEE